MGGGCSKETSVVERDEAVMPVALGYNPFVPATPEELPHLVDEDSLTLNASALPTVDDSTFIPVGNESFLLNNDAFNGAADDIDVENGYQPKQEINKHLLEVIESGCASQVKRPSPIDTSAEAVSTELRATMMICKTAKAIPSVSGKQHDHWGVFLDDFSGNKSWLLSHQGKVFVRLDIDLLLPSRFKERHRDLVNTTLNATKNICSHWNNFFNMLTRPLAILHPHTQEELLVYIEMDYDKERTEDPNNVDGTIFLSVTLRKIDQALYLSIGPNLWRTRATQQVTFARLLATEPEQQEDAPRPRSQ